MTKVQLDTSADRRHVRTPARWRQTACQYEKNHGLAVRDEAPTTDLLMKSPLEPWFKRPTSAALAVCLGVLECVFGHLGFLEPCFRGDKPLSDQQHDQILLRLYIVPTATPRRRLFSLPYNV
jgi:hypothetical protein